VPRSSPISAGFYSGIIHRLWPVQRVSHFNSGARVLEWDQHDRQSGLQELKMVRSSDVAPLLG
jgi:hypothetical protein